MNLLQPGTFDIETSHARAWQYYAETVYPGNENNFLARKCTSMKAVDVHNCVGPLYPMGIATPFNLKGKVITICQLCLVISFRQTYC